MPASLIATAAEVFAELPVAFPERYRLEDGLLTVYPLGERFSLAHLELGPWTWFTLAGLTTQDLDAQGLSWTFGTGDQRGMYCATADRLYVPHRRRPSVAVAFAPFSGLALCAAACRAVRRPEGVL